MNIPQEEALDQLVRLIDIAGEADRNRTVLQVTFDGRLNALKQEFVHQIDAAAQTRDKAMDDIHQIVTSHRDYLMRDQSGKTLITRAGTIELRTATESLEVDDDERAFKWLRRHGLLRRFTKFGKRTVDKVALKKYLRDHPELVDTMRGMRLEQHENMTVKPASTKLEIVRKFKPFRRQVT